MNIWYHLTEKEKFELKLRHQTVSSYEDIDWSYLSDDTRKKIRAEGFEIALKEFEEHLPVICEIFEKTVKNVPGNTVKYRKELLRNLFVSANRDIDDSNFYNISTFGMAVVIENHIEVEIRFDLLDTNSGNYCNYH